MGNLKSAAYGIMRHAIATAAVAGCALVATAAFYFALIAWAILRNADLGGPLTLPAMILLALAGTAASVLFVLAPGTLTTEFLRARVFRANRFAEIPIASLLLILYLAVSLLLLSYARGWSAESTFRGGVMLAAIELVLLGIYWWALQATGAIATLVSKSWATFGYWIGMARPKTP
jgi:hypothetical protein